MKHLNGIEPGGDGAHRAGALIILFGIADAGRASPGYITMTNACARAPVTQRGPPGDRESLNEAFPSTEISLGLPERIWMPALGNCSPSKKQ